ncbi:transporter [Parasphingorhabdus sp. JC815]|uniref:transporter n=1 Tax=Parasphingorhabdus sp. JC815 TaxID=3232140 RepID=UPI003457954E
MKYSLLAGALVAACFATPTLAHDVRADDHAPIGVMADHAHKKGEFMFSVRHMHMEMSGNQIGTNNISPEDIVTSIPNRFAAMPGQPPTLRIVPTEMRTDMTMVGAMYAPTDWITLLAMGNYVEKEMEHTTFAHAAGTHIQGTFSTNPKGLGDITLGGIFPIFGVADRKGEDQHELNVRAAVSIPTGSTTKTAKILTPMGMEPTIRIPYMMQSGSGTWDLKPSVTYKSWHGAIGMGSQYSGTIRTGTNDQGYRFGDVHELTTWVSYRPAQWISLSGRVMGRSTGKVQGIDPMIMGPVQTANPDFQGGERVDIIGGINLVGTHGPLAGHRLGIEVGAPVYQDLNGPQMAGDWMLTIGWQKAF